MKLPPFAIVSQELVDVAMGRKPADLVIQGGMWVCVQSGEIIPGTDIAISGERIAYVGPDASHCIGQDTLLIKADGRYLLPGLVDGHMHVESGMLTVTEFVRAVIPHGTTSMFIDPHEIGNVFGMRGVKLMVDEAAQQPIHVWVQMPSCVPSAPGFETPGATIDADDVAQAMQWNGIIGLGEMMNFPGVINNDAKLHSEMAYTRAAGKIIGGHYPSPDLGLPFHGYVAGGAADDHEGTRPEDAAARVRQGMKAMLRFGSAWHDVAEGAKAITELGMDSRHFILCTDDCHCQTLVEEGHVNRAVQQAIANGIEPITAIQMTTLNPAEHFGVSQDIGMIAPGRFADVLIVADIQKIVPDLVIARGKIAAENSKLTITSREYVFPDWALHSVKLPRLLVANDFRLLVESQISDNRPKVLVNVIGVIENQAPTRHLKIQIPVQNGEIRSDPKRDLAKIALVDRHHGTGKVQVGLVSGFGLNDYCAIGSTVAHDCHQMILVGSSDEDIAIAGNELMNMGGGQVVIQNGKVIARLFLPIAGLMSDKDAKTVAMQTSTILEGFKSCGCMLNNPNMQLSLLALVVIPELRISDLGLVDVNNFTFIPVIE